MDIIQTFYNNLASQYDKLFFDWESTTREQANILGNIFVKYNFNKNAKILDCACGIGTQAIGLAEIGYKVTASDISDAELEEAKKRAKNRNVKINFKKADFRSLSDCFCEEFDIILAMDNALPHMLTKNDLNIAITSITNHLKIGGIFIGSIRDYDTLLESKPLYSPPYIHKTDNGQNVSFQTWEWHGQNYKLIQYIIEDKNTLNINKFECEYRAVRRDELTDIFISNGYKTVDWLFPHETKFYQPIIVAMK
ncbi:MAG: class I SAM-dependent methyltransferase [Clostridia bacterium]|nr:class I SAM-dependent methyltransferase [Clostridia bacterium]MBO5913107.1 class I SAM-dependent methyltransferase [Clostridia bacterium]